MSFYALRVVCQNCGAARLLGGGAVHDLTRWRSAAAKCRECGIETSAADAEAVSLLESVEDAVAGRPAEARSVGLVGTNG